MILTNHSFIFHSYASNIDRVQYKVQINKNSLRKYAYRTFLNLKSLYCMYFWCLFNGDKITLNDKTFI